MFVIVVVVDEVREKMMVDSKGWLFAFIMIWSGESRKSEAGIDHLAHQRPLHPPVYQPPSSAHCHLLSLESILDGQLSPRICFEFLIVRRRRCANPATEM